MRQIMTSMASGKYSWRKRIGSFMRNRRFSTEILHIVHGRLATQHARCHKELAAGGEPSTRFPPEGLAETADLQRAVNRQPGSRPKDSYRRLTS